MKCERCGAELIEGIDNCINCGYDNSNVNNISEEAEEKKSEIICTPQVPSVIEVSEKEEKETKEKRDYKKIIFTAISVVVALIVLVLCFYASSLMNRGALMLAGTNDMSGFGMMQIFGNVSYAGFAEVFYGLSFVVRAVGIVAAYFIVYCGFKRK